MDSTVRYLVADAGGGRYYRRTDSPALWPYTQGRQYKRSMSARSIAEPGFAERFAAADRAYKRDAALARKAVAKSFGPLDNATIAYLVEKFREARPAADQDIRDGVVPRPSCHNEQYPDASLDHERDFAAAATPELRLRACGDTAQEIASREGLHLDPA